MHEEGYESACSDRALPQAKRVVEELGSDLQLAKEIASWRRGNRKRTDQIMEVIGARYRAGDYIAFHRSPIWKNRVDFIFNTLIDSKNGRNQWEQLWGQRTAFDRVTLCCIPFFAYDISLGDEIEIGTDLAPKEITQRSGQATFRVWFGGLDVPRRDEIATGIGAITPLLEWSSANLLAASITESKAQPLIDYLQLRESEGLLTYETGRSASA